MQKVTLGGKRLGSGKKMDVELKSYERSNHNQDKHIKTTMSAGTLVPFYFNLLLPGSTIDINMDMDVKTHPAIGPLFGTFKGQADFFTLPVRLYQGRLHNNPLEVGFNMSSVKLPLMTLYALPIDPDQVEDIDNAQVNPSCLLKYLGISGIGLHNEATIQTRDFHAIKLLGYWDTIKNYYANKQEKIGAVIHAQREAVEEFVASMQRDVAGSDTTIPALPTTGNIVFTPPLPSANKLQITQGIGTPRFDQIILQTNKGNIPINEFVSSEWTSPSAGILVADYDSNTWGVTTVYGWRYITLQEMPPASPAIATFDLQNIDLMRKYILNHTNDNTPVNINSANLTPYSWLIDLVESERTNYLNSQEGLALKTYQSDIFNNWLDTEFMDTINTITAIDTSSGSFTMDTLLLQKKIYMMLNRVAAAGGSYIDWIQAVYDHTGPWRAETPVYHGGMSKEIGFEEIWANSESQGENGVQPLGTLAGKGGVFGKRKGGTVRISVDEPTWVMGIVSITPRIDYSQGNDWDVHLKTVDDFHKPGLDGIGFEDRITEQMAWWDTKWDNVSDTWITQSAGKQPAWMNYRTAYNQNYGNFAIKTSEMFMTLNRQYQWSGSVNPATSAIDDLTTYIDPVKYNNIFAETRLDAQNFWVQIAMRVDTRRKMSAREMPNL